MSLTKQRALVAARTEPDLPGSGVCVLIGEPARGSQGIGCGVRVAATTPGTGENCGKGATHALKVSDMSTQSEPTAETALMSEIALLRALVCELYRPACAELGPACGDLEAKYSNVIERALQYAGL